MLSGLVILYLENEQTQKLNLEQTVEDKAHRMLFRPVHAITVSLIVVTHCTDESVSNHCVAYQRRAVCVRYTVCKSSAVPPLRI